MSESSIEWTDATWNPVRGCALTSPGCSNCYAMKFAHRFSGKGKPYDGLTRQRAKGGPVWTGEFRFVPEMLSLPMRTRKPTTWFVNSMSDLFGDGVSNEQIAAVFGVMAACPRHTFQVLTKRAARMAEWFRWVAEQAKGERMIRGAKSVVCAAAEDAMSLPATGLLAFGADNSATPAERKEQTRRNEDAFAIYQAHIVNAGIGWPLSNVWIGVSVENQEWADKRVPHLLRVPAAVRFVSYEPALDRVQLRMIGSDGQSAYDALGGIRRHDDGTPINGTEGPRLSWVIAGAESGQGARPMSEEWARSMRDDCAGTGVAFFYKQRVDGGKKVSLPMLDGRQWAEMPEASNA